jgi:hypothetical protein
LFLISHTRSSQALQLQALDLPTETSPIFSIGEKETKFIVSIQNTVPDHDQALDASSSSSTTILITSKNGSQYRCILPKPSSSHHTSLVESDMQQDGIVPLDQSTPEQLLEALKNVCAYRIEDWWTYEVCYLKQVKQYHSESKKMIQQHNLGEYEPGGEEEDGEGGERGGGINKVHIDTSSVSLPGGGGEQRYVSQHYTNGDICELTGERRSSEVRFTCDPGSSTSDTVITSITEPHSCHYVITVATYRLCKHPEFRQHPAPVVAVKCYPLTPPLSSSSNDDSDEDEDGRRREEEEDGSCVMEGDGTDGHCSTTAPKQEDTRGNEQYNHHNHNHLPSPSSELEITTSLKEALANLSDADLDLPNEEEGEEYDYSYVETGQDEYGSVDSDDEDGG